MRALRLGIVSCSLLALLALATAAAFAQFGVRRQRPTPSTGPRALAVVIPVSSQPVTADKKSSAKKNQYIIVPVTLFYQGRYYDASIYKANPVPMALWAETVYDVERDSESVGTITVDSETNVQGGWQGTGQLHLKGEEPERKASSVPTTAENPDQPPRLRRSGSTPTPPASPPTPPPTPSSAGSTSAPAPTAHPTTPEAAGGSAEDESRPRLQRGKPAEAPSTPAPTTKAPAPAASAPMNAPQNAQPAMLVAISDASTKESHSFKLNWSAAETDKLAADVRKLASDAAAKYVAQRFPVASPAAQRSSTSQRSRARAASATRAQLEDVSVKFFDLDADNNPEVVLTARESLPTSAGGTRTVYLTIVARDEQGSAMYPLLSYITDDQRLDEFPRLELIDAVDADGDGIAELLFRSLGSADENGNLTRGFQLYRIGPDRLRKVFDSRGSAD